MFTVLSSAVGFALLVAPAPVPKRSIVVQGAVIELAPDFSGHVKAVKTDAGPRLRLVSDHFSLDTSELTIRMNGRVTVVRLDKDGYLDAVTRDAVPVP